MDSFATWKAREGALRAISCFSDKPELDELSEITETAGTGMGAGGGGTGGAIRVIDALEWCRGKCGVLCEWIG